MIYVAISFFVLLAAAILITAWFASGEIARDYHYDGRSLKRAALRSVLIFSVASYIALTVYFALSYLLLAGSPSITFDGIKELFLGSLDFMPKILAVLVPVILIRVTWVGSTLQGPPRS